MIILWIVLAALLWLGAGLLGSAIAFGSIDRCMHKLFPSYTAERYIKQDRVMGYAWAITGMFNLLIAVAFSAMRGNGFSMRWNWLKK